MRLWQREETRGITILRVPLYPDHSRSVVGRSMNYLSFALSATTIGAWLVRSFEADVLFAYFAPVTMGWTTFLQNRRRRIPVVYWVTDMWPENIKAAGAALPPRLFRWIVKLERWSYTRAAAICVDSPGYEPNLLAKGVPAHKIHVVSEWADENLFFPTERCPEIGREFGLAGRFNVMYAGNLGIGQRLQTLIEAAELLQDLDAVQFVFIGDGTELAELQQQVRDRGLRNVRFIARQPLERIRHFLAWGDLLVVHLRRQQIFTQQLPSKVLAYLACGRPILSAVPGVVETVIRDAGAGVCCPSEDPATMAEQVRLAYRLDPAERESMGRRGREVYLERFNRSVQVANLERILREVVERP